MVMNPALFADIDIDKGKSIPFMIVKYKLHEGPMLRRDLLSLPTVNRNNITSILAELNTQKASGSRRIELKSYAEMPLLDTSFVVRNVDMLVGLKPLHVAVLARLSYLIPVKDTYTSQSIAYDLNNRDYSVTEYDPKTVSGVLERLREVGLIDYILQRTRAVGGFINNRLHLGVQDEIENFITEELLPMTNKEANKYDKTNLHPWKGILDLEMDEQVRSFIYNIYDEIQEMKLARFERP